MALDCGHRFRSRNPAERALDVESCICPACPDEPLMGHDTPVRYGLCACCGTCWIVRDGKVAVYERL